jgi:hypothetical protein
MSLPGQYSAPRELLVLIYELLDAHADTIELGTERCDELAWAAHLDYLRALQRKSRELLARGDSTPQPTASEPR